MFSCKHRNAVWKESPNIVQSRLSLKARQPPPPVWLSFCLVQPRPTNLQGKRGNQFQCCSILPGVAEALKSALIALVGNLFNFSSSNSRPGKFSSGQLCLMQLSILVQPSTPHQQQAPRTELQGWLRFPIAPSLFQHVWQLNS